MPKLQIKTKQEVQRDIINAVVARTSLSDVTDSSTLKHFITALSTEIAEVYYQFTRLAELFDFRKAAGLDLDERAKEILGGTIERFEARRAVGQLEFTRAVATAAPVTIPAGTIVETADGTILVRGAQQVGCWCDDGCKDNNDCCPDYDLFCGEGVCEDGECTGDEDIESCPQDCAPPGPYGCLLLNCDTGACAGIEDCEAILTCIAECPDAACGEACAATAPAPALPLLFEALECAQLFMCWTAM